MALINSAIQILIYVFSLSTIINNYDPELHKNNYSQVTCLPACLPSFVHRSGSRGVRHVVCGGDGGGLGLV
jgi:hypothetical protein